jgi:uncharacterized protein involved in outer membrane biogenesis
VKYLRILFSIFVLLLMMVAIIVVGLVLFIDPNKLKPVIMAEVAKKTGYQLAIDGRLSWSFYPRLGIRVEHMVLSRPGQPLPWVDLHDVNMVTKWMPLLRGEKKLQGDIRIADVTFMALHANQVRVKLDWQKGTLILQPIVAFLYAGQLQGHIQGSHFSTTPQWSGVMQWSGIQLEPLLHDVNPVSQLRLTGTGQINCQIATQGRTTTQMLHELHGMSQLRVQEGTVDGVDLNYWLQTADAWINRQPVTTLTDSHRTAFQQLEGTLTIQNGVARTSDLWLVTPAFTTKGQGQLDFIEQTIQLQLQTIPQATKTKWLVPLRVSGPLIHPAVQLDRLELEKWIVKQQIEKLRNKANEEVKKHLSGQAGEFLQRLLGQP